MIDVVNFSLRSWSRRTLTVCLVAAIAGLCGSSATAQDRLATGRTLNDLFIAIYANSARIPQMDDQFDDLLC